MALFTIVLLCNQVSVFVEETPDAHLLSHPEHPFIIELTIVMPDPSFLVFQAVYIMSLAPALSVVIVVNPMSVPFSLQKGNFEPNLSIGIITELFYYDKGIGGWRIGTHDTWTSVLPPFFNDLLQV
jgi:hypothetical protein